MSWQLLPPCQYVHVHLRLGPAAHSPYPPRAPAAPQARDAALATAARQHEEALAALKGAHDKELAALQQQLAKGDKAQGVLATKVGFGTTGTE